MGNESAFMALLQPKLNLKVAQRQVLTPGLMQMVSVLALNKLELKEMIDAEMVENPVLEEIDESVPMLDQVAGRAKNAWSGRAPGAAGTAPRSAAAPKDSFNEVDFGSYFQDYLDPGYRTQPEFEDNERPSFENFLSQPTTLSDHLAWQLGALTLDPQLARGGGICQLAIWTKTAIWPPAKKSWPRLLLRPQNASAQPRTLPSRTWLPLSIWFAAPLTWCSISTPRAWAHAICASAC